MARSGFSSERYSTPASISMEAGAPRDGNRPGGGNATQGTMRILSFAICGRVAA
jgi:hypothetical protein